MVRNLFGRQMGKLSGPAPGTTEWWLPSIRIPAAVGVLEESQVSDSNFTAPSSPRARNPVPLRETWMFEVAEGIKTQWETHSRGFSPVWSVVAGSTVPEKSGSRETPGDGRRVGP